MRGGVAVQRDHSRGAMLPRGSEKEPLGGSDVTSFAQEEIDGPAFVIHRAIQVHPLPAYFHAALFKRLHQNRLEVGRCRLAKTLDHCSPRGCQTNFAKNGAEVIIAACDHPACPVESP